MINHMHKSLGNWNKAQIQVATGKQYTKFSENTAAAARVLSLNNAIADITRTDTNIDEATTVLTTAEGALNSMTDVLRRINELTLQAANGTSNAEDLNSTKIEIDELIKQIVNYANTSHDGMYLFGGNKFSEKPFELVFNAATNRDEYQYKGSTDSLAYNISDGYSVDVLRNGKGLESVLNNLQELSATLGEAAGGDDTAKGRLSGLAEKNSESITIVTGVLTDIGTTVSSLNTHKTAIYSQRLALETRRSNIEDADQTQAITDVNMTRFAYEATLSMIGQMNSTNILKYL